MRLLITGAAGMLGREVSAAAEGAVALSRSELDITDPGAVGAAVRAAAPDVVVNCAAYTDVDGAEEAVDESMAINGVGAGNVARSASAVGAWTIHISSDYVFDGSKREPYVESDATGPVSRYGSSKLAGERAVTEAAPDGHTIVRSSWLFGTGGPCFPATILRLARERDELTVVDDQVGCPTFTAHLARALLELAAARPSGIVHVAGSGQCSWYEFAGRIVERAGLRCRISPGRTEDLARPAPRPAYSVLASERDAPRLAPWAAGLDAYLTAVRVAA
jgi:dTDP-4-dehydrorhamnose reductase